MTATLIVAATVLSYAIGWVIGRPLLVPVLNTLASYCFMVAAIRRGDLRLAFGRMLVWALALGVCSTLLSYAHPLRTDSLFLRGEAYRREMFAWVLTGRGAESTPSLFIPQQLGHAALFSGLALATGSALAMPMGAILMNYMGHYVGSLAAASRHPSATMILAWVPWAVIRIVSFVAIGVVLAAPLVGRVLRVPVDWATGRRMLAWAGAGLVADIVLKALLAPAWQRMLLRVVGG
ncbi:MAG: hypothetical protein ACM3SQ_10305 [Betaproteobacteria bacterium]